jgi:hypothetical protein
MNTGARMSCPPVSAACCDVRTTDGGKDYSARVIGSDEQCRLEVDGRPDFPTAKFAGWIPRVGD